MEFTSTSSAAPYLYPLLTKSSHPNLSLFPSTYFTGGTVGGIDTSRGLAATNTDLILFAAMVVRPLSRPPLLDVTVVAHYAQDSTVFQRICLFSIHAEDD